MEFDSHSNDRVFGPAGAPGVDSHPPPAPLLDSKGAAALLNVPASWVLAEARADRIPHVRLGRYVRFDATELQTWRPSRRRGPALPRTRCRNGACRAGAQRARRIARARRRFLACCGHCSATGFPSCDDEWHARTPPVGGRTKALSQQIDQGMNPRALMQRAAASTSRVIRHSCACVGASDRPSSSSRLEKQGPDGRRRSYGTGSLYVRADRHGRETWYGQWHANGRRVKRKIGRKRAEGSRDGLTRAQAEAELRRLMGEVRTPPSPCRGTSPSRGGQRYLAHLKRAGRSGRRSAPSSPRCGSISCRSSPTRRSTRSGTRTSSTSSRCSRATACSPSRSTTTSAPFRRCSTTRRARSAVGRP